MQGLRPQRFEKYPVPSAPKLADCVRFRIFKE